MHYIFGNYGNNTIAVIQWAYINNLKNVTVIHVETGSAVNAWKDRVQQGQNLANTYNFETITLNPNHNFIDLVRDRKSFPNAKYQWCPTFLKALPFLNWLDERDNRCEGIIILGSRRKDSRARATLSEFTDESEYYGHRKVWYPLFNSSDQERNDLIGQTGLKVLNHRSLECNPCIHSRLNDFHHFEEKHLQSIADLELEVEETMFHAKYPNQSINTLANLAQNIEHLEDDKVIEAFDMGCGSRYVCGE